jgi:dipeptidyl aminopeptidase/acylaminoacyl peptidase
MRLQGRLGSLFLALFVPFALLSGQTTPKSASRSNPAQLRALFDVRTFKQAAISLDGKRVAWVEELPGPGGRPSSNSAIYVADLAAPGHSRRITAAIGSQNATASSKPVGQHEEHDVAWSPDSKRIAFLSDAASKGQLQLYVVDATDPAARPKQLSHFKGFVSHPAWSPDGKMIALLYIENAKRASGPLVAESPDVGVIENTFTEQRLALVDPETGAARQITPADMYAYEFDWAPDSKRLVLTAAHGNGDDNWWVAGLYTVDASTASMHAILLHPGTQIADPRWSPDGQQIAFIGGLMSDQGVTGGDIYLIMSGGGKARDATPNLNGSATALHWSSDSQTILFAGIAGGSTALCRLLRDGTVTQDWFSGERISAESFEPDLSVASDGRTSAVIRQSFSEPPEVWAGTTGNWKEITHVNAGLRPAWGSAEQVNWTTDIGLVHGWLLFPLGLEPGDRSASKKYPMVVVVHGGPASATIPSWPSRRNYYMALPSQGYFLFFPNPRGSYGEGEKFTRANVKDFGYGDWHDILAGVDKAIGSAPIDPDRLGLTGWSYGGYMTMWGVTQSKRFRAAVAGAGLSDWLSYYGENKIDQWMVPYFGASIYEDPAVYAKSTPINYIKHASTPTLIVVGQYDGECPAPQSLEFWHALETLGVPTRLVIYPNEGHMFVNPAHSRDVIERTIDWFNVYLKPAN